MINLFVGGFQFEEAYKYLLDNRCVIVDEQLKNVISEWDECMSGSLKRSTLDITELPGVEKLSWELETYTQYYLLRLPPEPIHGHLTGEVIKL